MLKDYLFYDTTRSFCSECDKLCDSKIIIKNGSAFLQKRCPEHGEQLEVFEEDASYLDERNKFDKPGNKAKAETPTVKGCPFDCGLCPDHEQHTCIGLIEVTQKCDLGCPVCYASSGEGEALSLQKIEEMMDFYKMKEGGKPEILQISGGEPTTHPDIQKILKIAVKKKFKYIMLNTNGIRLSIDKEFCKFLKTLTPGFEVYLQFDSLKDKVYKKVRGRDLIEIKKGAIKNLSEAGVPITLVATVIRDVNDKEIGDLVRFGLESDYIRGLNFQPIAFFGRGDRKNLENRTTLSGIRREIGIQTKGLIAKEDIIPLPCNIDRVAVTYLIKKDDAYTPITRKIKLKNYLEIINNTMDFRAEVVVKNAIKASITQGIGCDCLSIKDEISSLLPSDYIKWTSQKRADFIDKNTFRITISSFIDKYNFDSKSIKKECVHVITPNLKRTPFSAYNMIHREEGNA